MLDLLKNQIDITRVPFSDRGSRLLVFQHHDRSCLFIKLAERLIHVEPGIESYLRRPPFMDELCLLDKDGQVLDFQVTTSPEVLQFTTSIGIFRLAFQDSSTLVFGLPDHATCGIRFRVNSTHWHRTEAGGSVRHVRNISYEILNGELSVNRPAEQFPGAEIIVQAQTDCSICIHTWDGVKRIQPSKPFSVVYEESRTRWEEWFKRAPTVNARYLPKYAYAWWVMANNLVNPRGYLTRQAMVPSKSSYVGAWLWDSALHAVAYRYIDAELARDQVRVMLARQLPDGMLPDAIFDEGVVTEISHPFPGRVTKPPILAWAVLKIHEMHPDLNFLHEVYESLVRENRWWFRYNDDDRDGIVQYTHPYSSGLDDSPLWDHGMPVESPDINTHLQIQMMSLGTIAKLIGRPDAAKEWHEQAAALTVRMIEHLWDDGLGIFHALHNEKPIPVLTPFSLLPIWTGQLPDRLNQCIIDHLQEPEKFMGAHMLPTVAYNDSAYNPHKMWRGPVWANINYFFIEALQKIGQHELAATIRDRTLEMIASQPGISEYYDSSTGIAPDTAIPAFGWTSAVFIEFAIQASCETKERTGLLEMNDNLWYKDAIFYQLYIRAFYDSNADGHGDIKGLTQKLDYLQDLGVDCLWLMPIYPSPLKDDGYDIADYYNVAETFGNIGDLNHLIENAHERNMRIIMDLVLNHTSDQHPWFQAARADRNSPYRDYYVWSDSDQKYKDARIIFIDTEPSNWTWDEIAGQYYWHRFYASQPDLNYDNPEVQEEMLRVARFWLDLGIDGFRADAVPYLFEREGTNCENLPETHAYLKTLRSFLESNYPGRILLCEANQWPADVRPYFGDGDEFHMGFHFPIMPRIYMGLKKGIANDMRAILARTPAIPDNCQWCIFLRNHDELTLEMVTEEERQWMWEQYAPDPRMKLNLGIRRRLAALLEYDRRKIELAYSLLLTLPGSPVLYYGDEIGMGDNIWLFDRNGVRTPMQWDAGPSAGFSKAPAESLFAPVIGDEIFGPTRVNVESQRQDPDSLWNAIRHMIATRKEHQAFGRGDFEWLDLGNDHIAAFQRTYHEETIIVIHNLSDSTQSISLETKKPVNELTDLLTKRNFDPRGVELPPYEFLWLS